MKKYLLLTVVMLMSTMSNGDIIDITGDQTLTGNHHIFPDRIYRVDYELPLANSQILIQQALIDRYETYGTSHSVLGEDINGTIVQEFTSFDDSIIDIVNASAFRITCDAGTMNIYDLQHSTMDYLYVFTSIAEQGIMNIYATDCQWSFDSSSADLTGYWFNGESFQLHFENYQESALENVHIIPEPTTFLLLGLSGILLRRRT